MVLNKLRILHVLRKPLGGLFRHVYDLAIEQTLLGHEVGIICDDTICGNDSEAKLKKLSHKCALPIERFQIGNLPGPKDLNGMARVKEFVKTNKIEIIHGHGAKGGLFARLVGRSLSLPSVYTPHGGALHYNWTSPAGFAFLAAEKALRVRKSGLIFVCEFERQLFDKKIGLGNLLNCVAYIGLTPQEFTPAIPNQNARDLLFVGEMRSIKGIDVLLDAIAMLKPKRIVTATLVGDGPELAAFKLHAEKLGLTNQVDFVGRKTMSEAQKLAKILVLPSRNESFPYVVLEAIAAQMPVIATDVGGVSEVLPKVELCEPGNATAFANLIMHNLDSIDSIKSIAKKRQEQAKQQFSVNQMAKQVCILYDLLTSS